MEVRLGDYGLSVNLREEQTVTDFAGVSVQDCRVTLPGATADPCFFMLLHDC